MSTNSLGTQTAGNSGVPEIVYSLEASECSNITSVYTDVQSNSGFGQPVPLKGASYNFDNIPQELKDRPQWVVFRVVERGGKKTQPPFRSSDPWKQASTIDPTTWGSYEQAVACYQAYSWLGGIGYVFTKEDDYFGVDIDDKDIKPEFAAERERLESQLLAMPTYTERSFSGRGYHIIGRGTPPRAGTVFRDVGVEVYGSARFFAMTGNIVDGKNTVTAQPDFMASLPKGTAPAEPSDEMLGDLPGDNPTLPTVRCMDLTDELVIERAFQKWPQVRARYEAMQDCEPGTGKWTKTTFCSVVSKLDLITGDVAQIQRIVMASPMVTQTLPHTSGETRPHKAKRIFFSTLATVRQSDDFRQSNNFIVHGQKMVEQMEAYKEARRADLQKMADEDEGKLSPGAARVLNSFPQIGPEFRVLTIPPGTTGEFVQATETASHSPFTKYAIPATLATLSGTLGRQYKVDGSGMNLNFILLAPTSAGKTNTMKAWEGFIGQANACLPATPSGSPKSRIIKSSAASIQGMMPLFQKTPACVWFVEEAGSLLKLMNDPKSNQGATLRDKVNELFDCSQATSSFNAPASSENRKAGIEPVYNLNVSTF